MEIEYWICFGVDKGSLRIDIADIDLSNKHCKFETIIVDVNSTLITDIRISEVIKIDTEIYLHEVVINNFGFLHVRGNRPYIVLKTLKM